MKRTIQEYKELEQLAYHVYKENQYKKPDNWNSLKFYKNEKNGFYAEAFENTKGDVFLIFRGTDVYKGAGEFTKDLVNDAELALHIIPNQLEDAYNAYCDIVSIIGNKNVSLGGYSLGASISSILGNELGIESVNFATYGVGRYVVKNKDENIINFGNYDDPFYRDSLGYQLGETYIIPKEDTDNQITTIKGNYDFDNLPDLNKHFPNQIGDISKAVKYEGYVMESPMVLKGSVYHEDFDDSIFDYKNRVYYKGELLPLDEFKKEDIDVFWDQAFETGGLPAKDELEARSRKGELIYVESYVRSDGTKVSGYYRKCSR